MATTQKQSTNLCANLVCFSGSGMNTKMDKWKQNTSTKTTITLWGSASKKLVNQFGQGKVVNKETQRQSANLCV